MLVTYQTFAFGSGMIIVSGDSKLNDEMSNNEKWFTFRKVGDLAVFGSRDVERELSKDGLPLNIVKFIAVHQHEVL